MKRAINTIGSLLGLLVLLVLGIGLVALLRGTFPITGEQPASPVVTPTVIFVSPLPTPTPAPTALPPITPGTIPPPPGWPTDQPWPPQVTTPSPPPTAVPQPFPTPQFRPTPRGTPPATLQSIWFPYFPNPASSPQLQPVWIDDQGGRWGQEVRAIDLGVNPYPPGPVLYGLHPSPDGRWIVAEIAFGGSVLIDLASGISRPIITDSSTGPGQFLAWAPDSRHVVVVPTTTAPEVWVLDIMTQKHQVIDFPREEYGPYLRAVAYSPDGKQIADALVYPPVYAVRDVGVVEIGVRQGESQPRTVLFRLSGSELVIEHSLRWSPNGRDLIFVADVTQDERTTQLWMIDTADGTSRKLAQLAQGVQYGFPATWSPDGRYIAVLKVEPGAISGKEAITNVHLIDSETGSEQQLTHFAGQQLSNLRWSPDGQWLAFTVSLEDYGEIWVTNLGGQQQYPIAGPTVPDAPFAWLP